MLCASCSLQCMSTNVHGRDSIPQNSSFFIFLAAIFNAVLLVSEWGTSYYHIFYKLEMVCRCEYASFYKSVGFFFCVHTPFPGFCVYTHFHFGILTKFYKWGPRSPTMVFNWTVQDLYVLLFLCLDRKQHYICMTVWHSHDCFFLCACLWEIKVQF